MTRLSHPQNLLALAVTVSGVVLMFVGSPSLSDSRLTIPLWDLGHVVLFFFLVRLVLQTHPGLRQMQRFRLSLRLFPIVLAISVVVELLQYTIGREAGVADVLRNLLGAGLALQTLPRQPSSLAPIWRRFLALVSVCLVLVALSPLLLVGLDTFRANQEFPVLSDMESTLQLDRWEGDDLRRVPFDRPGNHSLRALFTTAEYAAIKLSGMPRDWRGYRMLRFRIHHEGDKAVELHIRISDRQHRLNQWAGDDRYEASLELVDGWNPFELELQHIRQFPKKDPIDLSRIDNLGFFTHRAPYPQVFHFDDVELLQ